MKTVKATLLFLAVLLGATASAAAVAQHRHHHHGARFGLFIGAPAFYYPPPYYYNPYPYYYPRTVVVPAAPTTYVEQGQYDAPSATEPAPASSSWYFCRESGAYYPYVNQCAGPWERVAPRPAS